MDVRVKEPLAGLSENERERERMNEMYFFCRRQIIFYNIQVDIRQKSISQANYYVHDEKCLCFHSLTLSHSHCRTHHIMQMSAENYKNNGKPLVKQQDFADHFEISL